MVQKEKQLLLKDLCARLPYKLRVKYYYYTGETHGYADEGFLTFDYLNSFKTEQTITVWGGKRVYNIVPYLRPLSSMTEEEEEEYRAINCYEGLFPHNEDALDYVLEHHFDFRGLIPMGLALEAPVDMYKTH